MHNSRYIVIRNRNSAGQKVRPSNWAERLAGNAAQFINGRLQYDSRVIPCTACEGHICLRVDRKVQHDKPSVLATIEDFMRVNSIPDYVASCPRVGGVALETNQAAA